MRPPARALSCSMDVHGEGHLRAIPIRDFDDSDRPAYVRARALLVFLASEQPALFLHVLAEVGRELAQQILLLLRQLLRNLDLPQDHLVAAPRVTDAWDA